MIAFAACLFPLRLNHPLQNKKAPSKFIENNLNQRVSTRLGDAVLSQHSSSVLPRRWKGFTKSCKDLAIST